MTASSRLIPLCSDEHGNCIPQCIEHDDQHCDCNILGNLDSQREQQHHGQQHAVAVAHGDLHAQRDLDHDRHANLQRDHDGQLHSG